MTSEEKALRRIKLLTILFIIGLVISGATAIPLESELDATAKWIGSHDAGTASGGFVWWILKVRDALHATYASYPFMAYGTDWLAFGHFVIALVFVGVLRNPVRNRWLFQFGMIACGSVIPFAFVFGSLRGIPVYWRLIDCSFGVVGFVPMWLCHQWTRQLELAAASKETIQC